MEDRRTIIQLLYWDHIVDADKLLAEIAENNPASYPNIQKLFVRAFESLPWQGVLALFGIENIQKKVKPMLSR